MKRLFIAASVVWGLMLWSGPESIKVSHALAGNLEGVGVERVRPGKPGRPVKPPRPVKPVHPIKPPESQKPAKPIRPARPNYRYYWHRHDDSAGIEEEKEIQAEAVPVPVAVPPAAPQREWVEPVYEEKVIPGHYTHGIKDFVDENGVRTFVDDPGKQIWVPETREKVLVTPGYYKEAGAGNGPVE